MKPDSKKEPLPTSTSGLDRLELYSLTARGALVALLILLAVALIGGLTG